MFMDEEAMWFLVLMVVLAGFAARYWSNVFVSPIQEKLKESGEQFAKLQKVSENLGHTIHNFEDKMQKQLGSFESAVSHLSCDVGKVRRETQDLEKHVNNLEAKADVTAAKIDAIKHQLDDEVCELKRIDDQIKDSMGKVDSNARQIDHLEHEVHYLGHELSGPPKWVRLDRHAH
jgi:peptidoglycan hydrolase CwlO-like protein